MDVDGGCCESSRSRCCGTLDLTRMFERVAAAVVVPVVIFGVTFVVGGGDFLSACACALVLVIFSLDAWGKACRGIWEIGAAGSSANK